MRRSLEKLSRPAIGHATRQTLVSPPSFSFSTSAGNSGGGRGRGRGSSFPNHFSANTPTQNEADKPLDDPSFPPGAGHGRGNPLPPNPTPPTLPSFLSSDVTDSPVAGRGRGRGTIPSPQSGSPPQGPVNGRPMKPIFFKRHEALDSDPRGPSQGRIRNAEENNLPSSILSVLSVAGRGKPAQASSGSDEKVKEENRHIRVEKSGSGEGRGSSESTTSPKLSKEEAVNKARGILSRGGDDAGRGGRGNIGRGRGRGRGIRGRGGRGGGGWRGREDGSSMDPGSESDSDDDHETEANEKFAKRMGPERMNLLVEEFEEAADGALPCPMKDAYLDAMHTNYMIECEPEYLMADFCSNPDIDEKPPIPLREALEKMKPFLMAYENIQTNKEWEEVVEETMKTVPLMKEIVDYYSGPDRVTAKRQQEELERVAKTLPESAPASVKRFTERAVLSLQSNPGWGFDKKCQFMDKLVWEVSQKYK